MEVYLPSARGEFVEALRDLLDDAITLRTETRPDPARYRVLVAGRPSREDLEASASLEIVVIPWAGLPKGTRTLLTEFPGLAVHNLHHNAEATAESALALLLAAAKGLVPADRKLRRGDWRPRYAPAPAVLLHGKTALVLGVGAIGSHVARACRALGMDVRGVGRTARAGAKGHAVHGVDEVRELLPEADALLVCLPATPATKGLLGRRELGLLPAGAVLVNVGRADVIEERALYEALASGRLAGAGLDVWYRYPEDEKDRESTPPSKYPFGELDNVVLSPHRGGHSNDSERRRAECLASLLNAAARGQSLPHRVDVEAGY